MSGIRRSLRAVGALCLALLLYAATPHVHDAAQGERRGQARHETGAAGGAIATAAETALRAPAAHHDADPLRPREAGATGPVASVHAAPESALALTSDDAHESHRMTGEHDDHPCTLCRNGGSRAATHVAPTAPSLAPVDELPLVAAQSDPPKRAPLARRHAARAPPIA